MTTVNLQVDRSAVRVRTGVGMAGMFVVACFGAALFFTGAQSHASDDIAGTHSQNVQLAQTVSD